MLLQYGHTRLRILEQCTRVVFHAIEHTREIFYLQYPVGNVIRDTHAGVWPTVLPVRYRGTVWPGIDQ